MEWGFIDASYVKAHQHSAGAASGEDEAIGLSRAGKTTKIHLVTDSCGNLVHFEVTAGSVNDCQKASLGLFYLTRTKKIMPLFCDSDY